MTSPAAAHEAVAQAIANARLDGRDVGDPGWRTVLYLVATGEITADTAIAAYLAANT